MDSEFCGRRAPDTFSDLEFRVNRFGVLAIDYSLETVTGFGWESMILATFCSLSVPHSSRITHVFGDLSSGNRMTWVSDFGSEISIPL